MDEHSNGYTILEFLVVIGIMLMVSLFTVSVSLPELQRERVGDTANNVASALFLAQQNAYAGNGNTAHGIKFNGSSFEVFEGETYDTKTISETIQLPANVRITNISFADGKQEVVFPKDTIFPSTTGIVTFTDAQQNYRLTVNAEGLIYCEKI